MKIKLFTAIQLFVCLHCIANVQPVITKANNFAKNITWAFEENKGQVTGKDRKKVVFLYKQGSTSAFLLRTGLAYQFEKIYYPKGYRELLRRHRFENEDSLEELRKQIKIETYRMDIELVGANKKCQILTEGKSSDYIQYYNHNALDVHSYQKITYKNIYPNIDWVIYQSQVTSGKSQTASQNLKLETSNSQLVKYDFIVHPGGNPNDIKLRTHHVEALNLKPDGSLTIVNRMGSITEKSPVSYQGNTEIKTSFRIEDNAISFQTSAYNPSQELIIDPSVTWSTYYGGSENDIITQCIVDKLDNVYIVGSTISNAFIASGGHQMIYAGPSPSPSLGISGDAFLVKLNPNGKRLWATYYGGSDQEKGLSCAVDSKNNVYISGQSLSNSNVYYNGYQNYTVPGLGKGFFAKFNSNGVRIWGSHYYNTHISTITLDKNDNIVLYGMAYNFPNTGFAQNAHQSTRGDNFVDCFLAKFDSSMNRIFSTYYGGSGAEFVAPVAGKCCVIDNDGNIYICGSTRSVDNISYGGLFNTHSPLLGGVYSYDGFLVKFNPSGVRQWGTYLGNGNKDYSGEVDIVQSIDCDRVGNVIIGGAFHDTTLLTIKGYDTFPLLLKFNPLGQLVWGRSYLSNIGNFYNVYHGYCVATDSFNNIYYYARAYVNIPTYEDTFFYGGKNSDYSYCTGVVKFNPQGYRIWGMNFGGVGTYGDLPTSIALSKQGDIFISGYLDSFGGNVSTNLGKKGHQMTYRGESDGYLAKICQHTDTPNITISSNRGTDICGSGQIIFSATDTFEGDDPIYTWYKNGAPIGSDTNILILASFAHNDSFRCRLISNASCLVYDTVWSNKLVLKIKTADTTHLYDSFCSNKTYTFNNQTLNIAGLYRDTLMSSMGCDSFIFLHLSKKNISINASTYRAPCGTQSYVFEGVPRTQSGRYTATYTNVQGCDSFVELTLTLPQHTPNVLNPVTICPGQSYMFADTPRTNSNTYTQVLTNSQGCDSTITLSLTVLTSPTTTNFAFNECTPFTFKGITYNNSTQIRDTIQSAEGCDSIYTTYQINLSPSPNLYPDTTIEACDSIWVKGVKYQYDFSFNDTIKKTTIPYCDSIYQKYNYKIFYRPIIGLKTRDTFLRGSTVKLRPNPATYYLWSTGETQRELSIKLTEDKSLTLIAWNTELCGDTAQIELIAVDLAIVGMPTGFAPNGIHIENRTFRPNINGVVEQARLDVFNRWGEKIYSSTNPFTMGWSGYFKGEPAPAGLYSYIFEYTTLGHRYIKSGEVELVW